MRWYHPALFAIDPERAHALTIAALAAWARAGTPMAPVREWPRLRTRVAGIDFANPIGLAAGVDKDARAVPAWAALGFGAVEVGTLTPRAQVGNARPRLFRLPEDRAVVNRFGFNNDGIEAALPRIAARRSAGPLGINVGANKDSADRIADYAAAVARVRSLAGYVTINISSPNTPGLRDLQAQPMLGELIAACDAARREGAARVPLFLKIAPDLDGAGLDTVARAAIDGGIDALILGNTTVSRPEALRSAKRTEAGGLSGVPLAPLARARLAEARAATGGALPLVAAGGIDSGAEAYARVRAGASLVQLYTALVYEGPGLAARMARDLDALLARDGFASVAEAVGTG